MRPKLSLLSSFSYFDLSKFLLLGLLIPPSVYAGTYSGAYSGTGSLFNISASGTAANLNINLCLNGSGPLSCQNYTVDALTLSITTNIPNRTYSNIGIKINTPGYEPTGCTLISNGYCVFSASQTSAASIYINSTASDFVTIGNSGNAEDSTGFGAVNYQYKIGKYDVTIAQYTAFLNAVAATDTYGLYNTGMGTDLNIAGITQSGQMGSYSYTVMNNDGDSSHRPITYVSWINAARFANWMANGQPTGCQTASTTENGAYDLSDIDHLSSRTASAVTLGRYGCVAYVKNTQASQIKKISAISSVDYPVAPSKNNVNPNTSQAPTYYIPSENEWYKAAYYDPELNNQAGGYYLYPTQSNAAPGNAVGSGSNQANYFTTIFSLTQEGTYSSTDQNYLTNVGAFSNSASYYGTFDQGGEVWQWNDLDGSSLPYRGLRGGYWWSGSVPLQSTLYSTDSITRADNGIGFRLAAPV